MAEIFISLHDTVDSHFVAIVEGEPTMDGHQIAISAPEPLKGIMVRAKRFAPLAMPIREKLVRMGISTKPQILCAEKAELLRNALPIRSGQSACQVA